MTYSAQKTVCQLDAQGIFIGTTEADLSPLEFEEGVYLMPANALDISVPKVREGMVAQWWEGEWRYLPDYRGKTFYNTENGQAITIEQVGELPDNLTTIPPPSTEHYWDGESWVLSAKQQQAQFEQHRATLIGKLANKADRFKDALLVGYPQAEIESFYRQEKEALAYQADNQAHTPMLRQIAEKRGVPFDLLVQKVIEKSNQFAVAVGIIIGQRQAFEDRIVQADNNDQLTQIEQEIAQWQFDLNV